MPRPGALSASPYSASRIQFDVHPLSERRGDVHERVERKARQPAAQQIVDARLRHTATGRAKPSFVISHRLRLDAAPDAYAHFDARDDGWTKVVLKLAA